VKYEFGTCGVLAPFRIAVGTVTGAQPTRLPPLAASNTAAAHTTPGLVVQLAVGAGQVMLLLFVVRLLVPVDAVIVPDPCVPAQFAKLDVTATRPYDPAKATSSTAAPLAWST
jgi:hypothetical protein